MNELKKYSAMGTVLLVAMAIGFFVGHFITIACLAIPLGR